MTKGHLGIARTREDIQCHGDDADDERAEKRRPESLHDEMRPEYDSDQIKQERVDDEGEQTERENQQRQREEHHDRTDESVENPQYQCRDKRRPPKPVLLEMDAWHDMHRHQHRQRCDEPTLDEFFELRLHTPFVKTSRILDSRNMRQTRRDNKKQTERTKARLFNPLRREAS